MKITNRYGLPAPLVRAIEYDAHGFRHGDISITELVKPPQILELERQHDHEIEVDATDRVFALDGKAIHAVLEWARVPNALQEERLSMEVAGWTVTGQPDLYEADGTISDWKHTSVWALVYGGRAEWTAQLNGYAYLLRANGFPVVRLQVVPILRDWKQGEAEARREAGGLMPSVMREDGTVDVVVGSERDRKYPPAKSFRYEVPLWSEDEICRYFERRVRLHQDARLHHRWPPCSPEERWHRGEQWAVYPPTKKGAMSKRATAVFGPDSPRGGGFVEAQALAEKNKGKVQHRPGRSIRCESYCDAGPWCEQAKAVAKEEGW